MKPSLLPSKAERFCVCALNLVCLALFAVLFGKSFTSSWLNHDPGDEFVYWQRDSLTGNLVALVVALAVLAGLVRLVQTRLSRLKLHHLALVISVLVVGVSLYWVQASGTSPQADQEYIWEYSLLFSAGDFSGLQPGGYPAIYQQQLGLITVLRALNGVAPLFHLPSWHLFQWLSALTNGLLVYSGFRVVALVTDRRREAELLYLLFAVLCAPLYIYTAFVYGESGSTAFCLLATWMFLECLQALRPSRLIVFYLACALALLLRTNTLIVIIALGLVWLIRFLRDGQWRRLVVGLVLLAAVLTPTVLNNALYGDKIPADSKPVPAILHITMGVNDTAPNAGWYNGYNLQTYRDCGYDPKAASAVARQDLDAFLTRCREDPGYALDFYNRKFSSQWNAPMYQCIVMNNHITGTQTRLAQSLYEGVGNQLLTAFMNLYQLLLYGGVLAFTVLALRKPLPLEKYLLLVAVFGGFCFSLLWEAKARYIFPYFLFLLPYGTAGIAALLTGQWQWAKQRTT